MADRHEWNPRAAGVLSMYVHLARVTGASSKVRATYLALTAGAVAPVGRVRQWPDIHIRPAD